MSTLTAESPNTTAAPVTAMVSLSHVKLTLPSGDSVFTLLDIAALYLGRAGTFGLSGPSGSGKSTLLNIISGLRRPTSGTVTVDEVEITTLPQWELDIFRAKRIGYVFQNFNLIPALTARDNVSIAMTFAGVVPQYARRDVADSLLKRVGLAHRASHKPAALSHGEMQRVSIARAIANRPKLILADEPTASLEPGLAISIVDLLIEVAKEVEATLVIASHDPAVLKRMTHALDMSEINMAAGDGK